MGINIRTKGQTAERDVADALNVVIHKVLRKHSIPIPAKAIVQRNQNQSAVGGSDLSNTFGLSIEVKRQEALAINTWWNQCVASAKETREMPVLIYRQNKMKWSVVMFAHLPYPFAGPEAYMWGRVTITWDTFLEWFERWVNLKIEAGEMPRMN